jgi:hypothetical protein
MTLVLVGCLPFLAGVGAVLARLTTSLNTQATEAYTEVRARVCVWEGLLLWLRAGAGASRPALDVLL